MEERELPVGWKLSSLSEAGFWGSGGTPSRKNLAYYEGDIPWIKTGELGPRLIEQAEEHITESGIANSSAKIFRPGSVVIAMYGATIGKVSILAIPAATNQACAVAEVDEEITTSDFLFHYLCSQRDQFAQAGKGGAQPNISQGLLKSWPFPLPPLNEQRRIAAKLDTTLAAVDACRQRLDGVANLLKRFRQAVLAAATSGELTREWREDNQVDVDQAANEVAAFIERRSSIVQRGKPKLPVEPDLSYWDTQIPDSWHLGSVSMLAECLDSQRIPVKKENRESSHGLYPYYGANGMVDMVDVFIFDDELVLVTEDETFYGREKPIAYRSSGKCWVNNHAHVLRPEDSVSADYLCFCLMYYPVLPWLTGTTGRAKLTQAVLNSLPVAIPPQREMVEIVRRAQVLFTLADQLEVRLNSVRMVVDRLTQALLAKAFRGELVPQDPGDEPASVLLERIRAARQAEAGAGKPSRRGRPKAAAIPAPINRNAAPAPSDPLPPDLLTQLLRECGALSERALLAASELRPETFQVQLAREQGLGAVRESREDGQVLLEAVG